MKKNYFYPLKLKCIVKETIWGGCRIAEHYKKHFVGSIGETWELTVREHEQNVILNGPCAGMSLNDYLKIYLGYDIGRFPVLIKFIDAHDDLSIQVHPYGQNGKTEMWYIIDAKPDSYIIYGATPDVDAEKLRQAVMDGNTAGVLNKVKVKAGDTYFIPGGLIHAIGKGILLAEIQQNSDTTYRLYDYDRTDSMGNKRQLHIDKAISVFRNIPCEEISAMANSDVNNGVLANCEYFKVSKHVINGNENITIGQNDFLSILCISGNGKIIGEHGSTEFCGGDSFFIPVRSEDLSICGTAEVLITEIPQVKKI